MPNASELARIEAENDIKQPEGYVEPTGYKVVERVGDHQIVSTTAPEQYPKAIYAILKPNGWMDVRRFETVTDAVIAVERDARPKPLEPMTLALRQLQDARNELKTLTYADVGCIIHGIRRVIQHDPSNAEDAQHLLNRLLRR